MNEEVVREEVEQSFQGSKRQGAQIINCSRVNVTLDSDDSEALASAVLPCTYSHLGSDSGIFCIPRTILLCNF